MNRDSRLRHEAPPRSRDMRRSLHFVPGGNERMMQKALGAGATTDPA